jgi:penicillin-binding protein 2
MKYKVLITIAALVCLPLWNTVSAQELPDDGQLTIRPMLQKLGERLLKGKTGSIVAINPANGEILCLATNTPQGSDVRQAIGKPQAPGSTFKTA